MRPINLTMAAFGPYAGIIQVPMDQLGKQGVYLITGNTGAGKTTIFDAVKFALFGEASGDSREAGMLRSKYADDQTPTYVELTFEYGKQLYIVKRNPSYQRRKTKGEGYTEQKGDAQLTLPSDQVISGSKQVTVAVKELLGIDSKQFSQIAMIAQGQFKELLLASTEQRGEIFREIFKTRPYLLLQQKVREDLAGLDQQRKERKTGLLQYLKGIRYQSDSMTREPLERIKEQQEIPVFEELEQMVDRLLYEDKKAKDTLDQKVAAIDSEIKQVTIMVGKAENEQKLRNDLIKNKQLLEQESQKQTRCLEVLNANEEKIQQREKLLLDIQLIIERLSEYEQKDQANEQLKQIERKIKANLNAVKVHEVTIKSKREQIETAEKRLNELENLEVLMADLNYKIVDLNSKEEQIEKLSDLYLDWQKVNLDWQKAAAKLEQALKLKKESTDRFLELERLFLNEQAGILAGKLIDGEPCPVCGSKTHPEPAVLTAQAPSEQQLKDAKLQMEQEEQKVQQSSDKTIELKGMADAVKKQVEALAVDLSGQAGLEDIKANINNFLGGIKAAKRENKNQLQQYEQQLEQKKQLAIQLPVWRKEQKEAEDALNQLKSEMGIWQTREEAMRNKIAEYGNRLEYESKEAANRQIEIKTRYKEQLEQDYNLAKQNYDSSSKKVNEYTTLIQAYERQLQGQTMADTLQLQSLLKGAKDRRIAAEDERSEVLTRIEINQSALNSMRAEYESMREIEEQWKWMKSLADTLGGRIKGKEKIELETYVQMAYFDRIIDRANLRFMIMSGGQFELKRRGQAENRTSKSGLDLDVIDHYNGTQRSVNTLSGGESFKASLALALGLSDEIQASAGGIQLDTMFIDEGFGSLDEESLEQAMSILNRLSEGNKLVGIISHVTDLKEKIERQIVVTKGITGGSQVTVIR